MDQPAPQTLHGLSRREFLRNSTLAGAGLAMAPLSGFGQIPRSSLPSGVLFGLIGDYGDADETATQPVDRVGALIRSWNPDFVVSVGDDNYILGEASTIDVNTGKNFNEFIYPKGVNYPVKYTYPADAPLYNRFLSALGNHDYGDVADDFIPSPDNIAKSQPYIDYFTNAFVQGTPNHPNTTITFANGIVGQTYAYDQDGKVTNYQDFSEDVNVRVFDVRLGTPAGVSAVHLFFIDSCPTTPYGRFYEEQPLLNQDGTDSGFTLKPAQADWIQSRMAQSDATWKIVIFHHPPYNSGPDGGKFQYTLERWPYQAWGADAVITGHVHNYERLEVADPGDDGNPIPGAPTIPYFVCGSGGFVPEDGFNPNFVLPESRVRLDQYGAMLISGDEESLSLLYFDIDGVLRDTRTLWANAEMAPPEIQFESAEFPVLADAMTVEVVVRRSGSLSQAATVNYATTDGTAKAGQNYAAASGQLTFAAGESQKTIAISITEPVFAPGQIPWESLIFTVTLSSPEAGTSLGFFSSTTVLIVNNVATPLNNQDAFINQCYEDILLRAPTGDELTAAAVAIGPFDTWNARATWLLSMMLDNYAVEPSFQVAQIHDFSYLSTLSDLGGLAFTLTYENLAFWVNEWRTGDFADDEARLTAVSRGFNQLILEAIYYEASQYVNIETNNLEFITAIYETLVLDPLTEFVNLADLGYWEAELLLANTQADGRFLMLGRLATESFNPPPISGMHAFDLPQFYRNRTILGVMVSGVLRGTLPLNQFLLAYVDQSGNQTPDDNPQLIDVIESMLRSGTYAGRFTKTSLQAWLDQIKGPGLEGEARLAAADPENDGFNNLHEFAFALPLDKSGVQVTELRVEDEDSNQQFVAFSYREARNVTGVRLLVQTSSDLRTWTTIPAPQTLRVDESPTHRKRTLRIPYSGGGQRLFVRVLPQPGNL